MQSKVIIKRGEPSDKIAYQAIEKVFDEDVHGKKVLLKPNAARIGPSKSGLCTNPEVIKGVINFFHEKGAQKVFVGDSPIFGVDQWEALLNSGIKETCEQNGAVCVNLDEYSYDKLEIPGGIILDNIKITSFLREVDIVVSMPVMKTHFYTGATLSIKNMKGCLYKKEKSKLHRIFKEPPDISKGLTLDYGLADMVTVLWPQYVIIDGTVCMEGFGPGVGTPKNMDLVLASKNPLAADLVAARLMGMGWESIKHLNLILENSNIKLEDIAVVPENYMEFSQTFELPSKDKLQADYPNIMMVEKGTCSACTNTVLAFLKTHGHKFPQDYNFTLATGKDLTSDELPPGEVFLVGSCAAHLKDKYPLCKGCPPVGSSILYLIRGEEENEDED